MLVEQIWTANAGRNFNYLIACPETGEALAVDPLDHEKCLAAAKRRGLDDHADPQHPRAPRPYRRQRPDDRRHRRQAAGACQRQGPDRGHRPRPQGRRRDQGRPHRRAGMPRHARPHDVAYLRALARRRPGRCSAATRCSTPAPAIATTAAIRTSCTTPSPTQLSKLPDEHAGLSGARLHRQQSALHARPRAGQRQGQGNCCRRWSGRTPTRPLVTTLGLEKEINTFFRLTSPSVIRRLREAFPDLPDNPTRRRSF